MTQSQREYNQRRVSILDFLSPTQRTDVLTGANSVDCSAAISLAIDSGRPLSGDGYKYKISSDVGYSSAVDVDMRDVTLLPDAGNSARLVLSEVVIASGTVDTTGLIEEGEKVFDVDDSTGLAVGDLIVLECEDQSSGALTVGQNYVITTAGGDFTGVGAPDNDVGTDFVATGTTPTYSGGTVLPLWDFNPRPGTTNVTLGETKRISDISGNTITVEECLYDNYPAGVILGWSAYRPKGLRLQNVRVERSTPENYGGFSIGRKISPELIGCSTLFCGSSAISLSKTYKARVSGCRIDNSWYTGTSTSYGIQCNGGDQTLIESNQMWKCRRGVDLSGSIPSRNALVVNNISSAQDGGSCLGSHGGSDLVTFRGNTCIGGTTGIYIRGGRTVADSNTFYDNSTTCFLINYSSDTTLKNNMALGLNDNTRGSGWFLQSFGDVQFSKNNPLRIVDNTASRLSDGFVRFSSSTLEGLVLKDNEISFYDNTAGKTYLVEGAVACTISRYCIENNQVFDIREDFGRIGTNITLTASKSMGDTFPVPTIEQWSGAGSVDSYTINSYEFIVTDEGKCRAFVDVSFEIITNTVGVRLIDCPNAVYALNDSWALFQNQTNDNIVHPNNTGGRIYISADTAGYNTSFAVGSHRVVFDVSYPILETDRYN